MSEYLSDGSMGMGDSGVEPGVTWVSVGGVCKPSDFASLAKFQELQRQMNRLAYVKGKTLISVDGDLGPGTVSLYNSLMNSSTNCATIAGNITALTAAVNVLASSLGAPGSPPAAPKPATTPGITKATGQVIAQPPGASNGMVASIYDAFGGNPMIALAGVGIAGGLGYVLFFHKKKGRR